MNLMLPSISLLPKALLIMALSLLCLILSGIFLTMYGSSYLKESALIDTTARRHTRRTVK